LVGHDTGTLTLSPMSDGWAEAENIGVATRIRMAFSFWTDKKAQRCAITAIRGMIASLLIVSIIDD
jgi:hypothetical protein